MFDKVLNTPLEWIIVIVATSNVRTEFKPAVPSVHLKDHTYLKKTCNWKLLGFSKYVWPLSGHQELKG